MPLSVRKFSSTNTVLRQFQALLRRRSAWAYSYQHWRRSLLGQQTCQDLDCIREKASCIAGKVERVRHVLRYLERMMLHILQIAILVLLPSTVAMKLEENFLRWPLNLTIICDSSSTDDMSKGTIAEPI